MPPGTLVTGFLAFGGFDVNPSALLAQSCGRPFELLEVSFAAVNAFLDRITTDAPFDRLLMLGLNGRGTTLHLERTARNHVGDTPDVRGVIRGPGPIEPLAPEILPTTLFDSTPALAQFTPSDDAGCYLCNYVYYRTLRRVPHRRIGFVHVPPLEIMSLDEQRSRIAEIIAAVETPGRDLTSPFRTT